jgi:hypothetical protein
MDLPRRIAFALVVMAASACADDDGDLFCAADDFHAWPQSEARFRCQAAVRFAARDTFELVPTQAEVDRYLDYWLRTIRAEPILDGRAPQRHRGHDTPIAIYTSNALVIDAWNRAVLPTGDAAFDAIVSRLHADPQPLSPAGGHDNGGGVFLFTLDVHALCNEELVQARLLSTSSRTEDAVEYMQDEGTWLWSNGPGTSDGTDTAVIDFRFGWGDCFSGCRNFHTVQARVPPTGRAIVYDLGGDPLPDGMELSPDTLPPP